MEKKEKIYLFDWDENIIHMDSKLCVNYDGNDIEVSESEYLRIKKHEQCITPELDDFLFNFRCEKAFIKDLDKALLNQTFGKVFHKLQNAIMDGNKIGIITARGHNPNVFKMAISNIIFKTFTNSQLILFYENVGDINEFINNIEIYPVSYEKMFEDKGVISVADKKVEALKCFLNKNIKENKEYSVGFSDDNLQNLEVMQNAIVNDIKSQYPNINFVLYDTSNKNLTIKIKI